MEEREPPHPEAPHWESRPPSRMLTVGLALLTLSALYLLGPARTAMGWPAAAAVLLHIGLGLLLILPVSVYGIRLRGGAPTGKGRRSLFWPAFGLCALTGLFLMARAANGQSTAHTQGVWWTHLLAGSLAVLVFGAWGIQARRKRRQTGSSKVSEATVSLTSAGLALSQSHSRLPSKTLYSLLFLVLSTLGLGGAVMLPRYDASAYYRDTTATNAAQAESAFFPAGVRLAAASQHTAAAADYCGRAGCHADALQEWQGSAHQQAASDPVYQRVRQEYVAQAGATAALWCAGCHEPLSVVQQGRRATSTLLSQGANEGVGCVACHAATDVSARTGNGRFTLSLPQNYPFEDRQAGWQRRLHDFLLRVRPAPHQTAYLKPQLHASAEFCGACHRQSFNVPQNGYQFVHGADEWGTWQSGPFSGRMARTVGLRREAERTCQDCHFARRTEGKFSHASVRTRSWLTAASGKAEGKDKSEKLASSRVLNVDIFALRRPAEAGKPEEWIAPLEAPSPGQLLHAGETCLLDIVVSNRNSGHEFPAGYLDIEEAWLEVSVQDGKGHVLAESGRTASDQAALPPDTHIYHSVPLDRAGAALEHHELWKQVTTAYRRTIPAGGTDIARYRLTVPQTFTVPLTVQARLRCRSLRPDFAQWVGLKTTLPVTTLAEGKVTLPLAVPVRLPPSETETALRFVDYGLGLLAPKDAPDAARARRAFLMAQRLAPNRPEPFLGLGRAYLAEPELLAARAQFNAALRLAPNDPAAQADLGMVYSKQGEYDRALTLLRPLAQRFPQDGALQFDLGLTLFRAGDYLTAVAAFESSLAADPDNAAAHFQLKQCFQHLQRVPEARREEAVGQYLAEDRLFPLLVPPYLSAHPDLRKLAQPIPEHPLRRGHL